MAIRPATADDIPALCELILEHGPNPWNHLPPDEVRAHLRGINDASVGAVLAEGEGRLAGFVSFYLSRDFQAHQQVGRQDQPQGYVCEAVVHRELAGRGLGTQLLVAAMARLAALGAVDIYIERHEENLASAGMMRKAGFREVSTFDDPARRPNGSRRTTLCHWRPEEVAS
ncbi:GNAT family N-acetyltransferase [Metapseudomonas resinovorans]|nr:GNAT family N-acetyltransferase [Pseudomonas resinovorans]GLZ87845.1 GNAT family N-acetyltransferase [Pseudomonas resinovorans]